MPHTNPNIASTSGRRRQARREEKLGSIIEAAVNIFIVAGLGGFSLRGVAAAAGVRLATVQHYFTNRNTLIQVMTDTFLNDQVVRFRQIAEAEDIAPKDRLPLIIDELLAAGNDKTIREFYLSLWAAAAQDEAIRTIVRDGYDIYYGALSSAITYLNPELDPAVANDVMMSISCGVDGLCVARAFNTMNEDEWALACDRMKHVWLRQILQ